MASGGDDINHIDTSPPQEAYVLYGAVVGGPDQKDRFYDIRSDWPETEVRVMAISYRPRVRPCAKCLPTPLRRPRWITMRLCSRSPRCMS
jgi:hypothetical protein